MTIESTISEAIDLGMALASEKLEEELQAGIVKFPVDPILTIVHAALTDALEHFANRPVAVEAEEGAEITIRISD